MASAGIPQLVYASSLGVYAPGGTGPVDRGLARHRSGQLDLQPPQGHRRAHARRASSRQHPDVTVARFRPTVVVQRDAAWLIKSLYVGPLVPRAVFDVLRQRRLPVLPLPTGIALQFVHADDVGDLVIRLIEQSGHGIVQRRGRRPRRRRPRQTSSVRGRWPSNRALVRTVIIALNAAAPHSRFPPAGTTWPRTRPLMDTTKARDQLDWAPVAFVDGERLGVDRGAGRRRRRYQCCDGLDYVRRADPCGAWSTGPTTPASLAWTALSAARALGMFRSRMPAAAAMTVNLVSGTPMALERLLARRRDPVALLAPVAVGGRAPGQSARARGLVTGGRHRGPARC